MKRTALALAATTMLALASTASAQTYVFDLEGLQEVPPNASPAFGSCTVELTGSNIDVSCTFGDLIGNATAAHIHGPAPVGVNAGILLALTPTVGATSGTITGSAIGAPATTIDAITSGMTYINLHSTAFPGGEIRGQVVPEPTTMALVGMGAVALLRRRRSR